MLDYEQAYWNRFDIPQDTLAKYGVRAIRKIQWGTNTPAYGKPQDPIFGWVAEDGSIKIYRPLGPKSRKWYSRIEDAPIIGANNIVPGKGVVILSSLKDQMTCDQYFPTLSPFGSESNMSCWKDVPQLTKASRISVMYDGDFTGWVTTVKMMQLLKCDGVCMLPYFDSLPGNVLIKDFAEVVEHHGRKTLTRLINEIGEDLKSGHNRYKNTPLYQVCIAIAQGVLTNRKKIPFHICNSDAERLSLRKIKIEDNHIILRK